jgi:hypothetical protein
MTHSHPNSPLAARHLAALFLLVVFSFPALALNPAWLDELPTVERVLADTQGRNALDTKARQAGALAHLRKAIEELGEGRRVSGYLPDEKRLMDLYSTRYFALQDEARALTGPPDGTSDSPWAKWLAQQGRYERDDRLRAETVARYLSPATLSRLNIAIADMDARVRESKREFTRGSGREVSTWDAMEPDEQASAAGFAVILALLFGLIMLRELRKFGLKAGEPFVLRAGFGRYQLRHATGLVHDYAKWVDTTKTTTTTTYNTGQQSTSVSYSSVTHEAFKLRWDDGEKYVHVLNADLDVSNGSHVTAVWGLRGKKTEGDYFIFFDRSRNLRLPIISALQAALAPTRWLMLPALLLATVVSAATPLWLGLLPRTNATLRGFLGLFAGWVLMLLILGLIARYRAKRFARRDGPTLLAAIDSHDETA